MLQALKKLLRLESGESTSSEPHPVDLMQLYESRVTVSAIGTPNTLIAAGSSQTDNQDMAAFLIEALYHADRNRQSEAPPVRAGSDVALAKCNSVNSGTHSSSPPSFHDETHQSLH